MVLFTDFFLKMCIREKKRKKKSWEISNFFFQWFCLRIFFSRCASGKKKVKKKSGFINTYVIYNCWSSLARTHWTVLYWHSSVQSILTLGHLDFNILTGLTSWIWIHWIRSAFEAALIVWPHFPQVQPSGRGPLTHKHVKAHGFDIYQRTSGWKDEATVYGLR